MSHRDDPRSAAATLAAGGTCPVPADRSQTIQMAHGGGGRWTQRLIDEVFLPAFGNRHLDALHDGALLDGAVFGDDLAPAGRLAFSTDSFVIRPLFFPGGDIGSLAVHGTVNDLAMCGARPLVLSAGYILEEGFPLADLERIVASMQAAAEEAGVTVVTGDTKVVDRGKGDGVYINTAGLGRVLPGVDIDPRRARPGDLLVLSGELAVHGVAILSVREGLEFETSLESDSAALHGLVAAVLEAGGEGVHVLRDPTRGGLASAVCEIASQAAVEVRLREVDLPVSEAVRGACEILGLDPLYVANEGKCLAVVAPDAADRVVEAMRDHPRGRDARVVGRVSEGRAGRVVLESRIGGERIVEMLSGEQLPRIC